MRMPVDPNHPFVASKDWCTGFLRRHPDLGTRITVTMEERRVSKLTAQGIGETLSSYCHIAQQYDCLLACQHFNFDQTGVRWYLGLIVRCTGRFFV
jgi:hypothetical protein